MVSLGVPSSFVTIQSAPPVEVMPCATINRAAHTHTHTRGRGGDEYNCVVRWGVWMGEQQEGGQ
jgi:hypothetical protein